MSEEREFYTDLMRSKPDITRAFIETVHGPLEPEEGVSTFDGGVRESANLDVDPEQSHNEAIVALAEQHRQKEHGA